MKKQLITTTLALTMALSSLTGVFAQSKPEATIEKMDFNEFKKELKKDISKEELKELKVKYNNINKREEEVQGYWNQLYGMDIFKDMVSENDMREVDPEWGVEEDDMTLLDQDFGVEENNMIEVDPEMGVEVDYTFEEFAKQFKENVSKGELTKAEKIYKDIQASEKAGDMDKADDLFNKLFSLDLFDTLIINEDVVSNLTFDELAKDFKDDVSEDDVVKAKALFNKTIAAEKLLDEAWKEIDSMNLYQEYDVDKLDMK